MKMIFFSPERAEIELVRKELFEAGIGCEVHDNSGLYRTAEEQAQRPLTPTLSPSDGERENLGQALTPCFAGPLEGRPAPSPSDAKRESASESKDGQKTFLAPGTEGLEPVHSDFELWVEHDEDAPRATMMCVQLGIGFAKRPHEEKDPDKDEEKDLAA